MRACTSYLFKRLGQVQGQHGKLKEILSKKRESWLSREGHPLPRLTARTYTLHPSLVQPGRRRETARTGCPDLHMSNIAHTLGHMHGHTINNERRFETKGHGAVPQQITLLPCPHDSPVPTPKEKLKPKVSSGVCQNSLPAKAEAGGLT